MLKITLQTDTNRLEYEIDEPTTEKLFLDWLANEAVGGHAKLIKNVASSAGRAHRVRKPT